MDERNSVIDRGCEHSHGEALIVEWFERVWHQRDDAAVFELLDPEAEIDGLDWSNEGPRCLHGPAAFLRYRESSFEIFAQPRFRLHATVFDGVHVAGQFAFSARHRATQRPVDCNGMMLARLRAGRLWKVSNCLDFHRVILQLGGLDVGELAQAFGPVM